MIYFLSFTKQTIRECSILYSSLCQFVCLSVRGSRTPTGLCLPACPSVSRWNTQFNTEIILLPTISSGSGQGAVNHDPELSSVWISCLFSPALPRPRTTHLQTLPPSNAVLQSFLGFPSWSAIIFQCPISYDLTVYKREVLRHLPFDFWLIPWTCKGTGKLVGFLSLMFRFPLASSPVLHKRNVSFA